jgi:hypothetical protein
VQTLTADGDDCENRKFNQQQKKAESSLSENRKSEASESWLFVRKRRIIKKVSISD